MAHLLPENEQEEIADAASSAEDTVSDRLSPVEMPPPPSGEGDLHHRLGYLEATLRSEQEARAQERAILQQQASTLARVQQQTEIQEEELMKAKANVEEVTKEPGFFEKLLGGHHRTR